MAKFLITNDDGYGAPGIEELIGLCEKRGSVCVIAPDRPRSGVGHAFTTRETLGLIEYGPGRFSLTGMPADCVRVGLTEIVPEAEWVVAGINAGGNLGADVYTSGTLAAAREGALLGKPSLAISQYIGPNRDLVWPEVAAHADRLLDHVLGLGCDEYRYWNANLPPSDFQQPPIVRCSVDPSPMGVRYKREDGSLMWDGNYHERPRIENSDVDKCFNGSIALTNLSLLQGLSGTD